MNHRNKLFLITAALGLSQSMVASAVTVNNCPLLVTVTVTVTSASTIEQILKATSVDGKNEATQRFNIFAKTKGQKQIFSFTKNAAASVNHQCVYLPFDGSTGSELKLWTNHQDKLRVNWPIVQGSGASFGFYDNVTSYTPNSLTISEKVVNILAGDGGNNPTLNEVGPVYGQATVSVTASNPAK